MEKREGRAWTCFEWVVVLCFLFLSLSGWVRLVVSIGESFWLAKAGVIPGPVYLAVGGALWGLAGLFAVVGMFRRRLFPRIKWAILGAALFYAATYWIDRLVFSRTDGSWVNLPFAILITFLGLAYTLLVMQRAGK